MEQVKNYYKRFVKEGFDENGILNKFEIDCPDNYNFGYDIIDKFPTEERLSTLMYRRTATIFHILSFQDYLLRRQIFLLHTA